MDDFFLAIVPAGPQTWTVSLVNPGDGSVAEVFADTGGHATADDELIEAVGTRRSLGALGPRSAVVVGTEDAGSFDFAIWWRIDLRLPNGTRRTLRFAIPKYFPMYSHGAERGDVPVVGKPGWMFRPDQ